uniref:protein-serine/threonine phosphatase n=1 Tax=Chrysemys picta bellii TaxID=8478 RepID=A0A8C3FRG7_CHRPI
MFLCLISMSPLPPSHSFVMVKGAALLLPEEEKLETVQEAPPSPDQMQSQQEQHLQLMMGLLRQEDAIRLAVRLESTRPHRIRYLLLVSTEELEGKNETVLLGVDFPEEGSARCTLGMVLPLWSDTQVFLDGDGGFSVTSWGQTRIFKPISVQTMWSVLQVLHKACNEAVQNNHFPGGSALGWAEWYQRTIASEQSCINEWLAMSDLESVRPDSPALFSDRPTERELMERKIRAKLRELMATADLESITSKEIRTELERRTSCSLKEYKEFIDNEMLLIMAQMDRPSKIFDHLYLGSEWNAANLEELQRNRISHILNVTREIDNFFPAHFTYLNVRLYDEEASQLLPYWKETYHFISAVRRAQNLRVLVHCKMGVSRSASTVIAYAMKEYGWALERAYRHVQEQRPIVHPNPSFMKQLEFYQGILDASASPLWSAPPPEPAASPSPPQDQEEPGAAVPGSKAKQHPSRAPTDKTGKRRGQQRSRQVPRSHAQPCKQISYHPAPGKVHKAVKHVEGPSPRAPPPRRARAMEHRYSVAQLMDAALVLSRTREFEERLETAGWERPPREEPASPPPPSQEPQTGGGTLPPSRPRRMVRQASVDLEPGSG